MDIDRVLALGTAAFDLADPPSKRVVVAMSGGVDSSVVAALAKRAGFDVIGITLQLYDHGAALGRSKTCCAGRDIHDARTVASRLDIPHYVLDYEARFRGSVMEEFADSYLAGETPVPCIRCNQQVKFGDLLQFAKDLGASALATGHYISSAARADASGHRDLLTAADPDRDQSYFLFTTLQEQLDFLRFPLGGLTKPRVRALADYFGLVVAEKPDSQDICFVPDGRYVSLIERLRPQALASGDIVHTDGRVLGRHDGIVNYTIGQRRGLNISSPEPLYVLSMEPTTRTVVVGPREALACNRLVLRDVNWLGDESFEDAVAEARPLHVRVRSTRPPVSARLAGSCDRPEILLAEDEFGVSPGQACVFYEAASSGKRILGGGWIDATSGAFSMHRSSEETAGVRSNAASM
ncbi:tRNA-specific 2-thiouridylase [Rhodoligotrophos appendicifer]|uniref:tRNA 2-thiouridine(34) synthase MnmA n=1 Tax=Rhodoligotrophos appendicifer TaxID=987056 RepID=UPI001185B963|nr:tRNA 2-thiouridine(34) synthase MnmA [Rhodoligotrophos appendicifer]